MTINEAIGYADELARYAGQGLDMETSDVKAFGLLCADALRLAKRKEEGKRPVRAGDVAGAHAVRVPRDEGAV